MPNLTGATDGDPHAITLADALEALGGLRLLEYQVNGKTTATKLPQPSDRQKSVLEALGVKLPVL